MVKIAIAGASGQLAREVLDKLVETEKHEIIALVRKVTADLPSFQGVTWVQTTYEAKPELVQSLKGVHTVLCFFSDMDPKAAQQKRLIDAAVEAGVKRFAPSEWSVGADLEAASSALSWYAGKLEIRSYLKTLNKEKKILEYCLFQPGGFLDILAYPHKTTKHVAPAAIQINYGDMQAIAVEGHPYDALTLTAVEDIANVVTRAVEYRGEWPVVGGIRGSQVSIAELIHLAETIRGRPLEVDWVKEDDLLAGELKSDRFVRLNHPSIPKDQIEAFSKMAIIGMLISIGRGAWTVTDEWNQLLPDYKFVQVEEFLKKAFASN